jgi:hypothetical protein
MEVVQDLTLTLSSGEIGGVCVIQRRNDQDAQRIALIVRSLDKAGHLALKLHRSTVQMSYV